MVHESTYGTTPTNNIKVCFIQNLLEGFKRNQDILIGAFAQGRMQEVLYDLRSMQDNNLIPDYYEIYIDGPLGISTTYKYQEILKWFSPEASDFLPKGLKVVDPKSRTSILNSGGPKIIVTTSGMLSNGPAKIYVPMFLERSKAMIHLIGYAAEETLARTLLEAKRAEVVTIGNHTYQKKAVVKTTREKTSHITLDGMINFINQFENIEFMGINHGEKSVKDGLTGSVAENCPNVKMVDVLNRESMYCIYQFGRAGEKFSNIVVKKLPAKLQTNSPADRKMNISKVKQKKQQEKKQKRRQEKNNRKKLSRKKNKPKRK